MNLLLLSSSRVGNTGYLEHALPLIHDFLNTVEKDNNATPIEATFIPYAGVSINNHDYFSMVSEALSSLNIKWSALNTKMTTDEQKQLINASDCIMVGGGNTFALLNKLYEFDLLESIRSKMSQGGAYIGWSAGSNIAGTSIKTTNDMPIIEPPSFNALNLVPFQLNPHYLEESPEGHNGETRQQRIEEFMIANPNAKVVAIPEGSCIQQIGDNLVYLSSKHAKLGSYLFVNGEKLPLASDNQLAPILLK